jgi:hypothetical protein
VLPSPQMSLTTLGAGRGGGGIGGDTPATLLTGLIGWWDASVFASMTIGTGSAITAIADQSGAGNNLVQGPFGGPVYNATGFNSKPSLTYSDHVQMKKASFAFGTGNTLTVFFVGQMNSITGAYGRGISYHAGTSNDADNNASFHLSRDNTNAGVTLYRNGSTAARAMTTGFPHRVIATVDSSGVMTIYVDGAATTGSTLNAAFGASGTLAIGMLADDLTNWWEGIIPEAGIATGFTNPSVAASLDSYLQTKWG